MIIYKYPQKSFTGYFLFFEFCISLGTIVPLFLFTSIEIEYKTGFLIAFFVGSFMVYTITKKIVKMNNVFTVMINDKDIIYKDVDEKYVMNFETVKSISIENIKNVFQFEHKIITLDDGLKKISFANFITDHPVTVGFLAEKYKQPDTTQGNELFDLIMHKSKQAKINENSKQILLSSSFINKNPKLLYAGFIVIILNGLRFIVLILEKGFKIAYIIDVIIWFGLAIFLFSLIKKVRENK